MDTFTRRYYQHDSPFGTCVQAWLTEGHEGLETFTTRELEAHRSTARGLEESGNYLGSRSLHVLIRDMDEHLGERWEATAPVGGGILSCTPGSPEHYQRVSARYQTDAARDGW